MCAAPTFGRQRATPAAIDAQAAARINAVFAEFARSDAPGCAVGVARDGEPIYMQGYGRANLEFDLPITPQTAFNIGSIGKQFTALATLLLEQQGKLSLDDDVRKFVPEMPEYPTAIRISDLLYHTSGLRDYGTLGKLAGVPAGDMNAFLDLMSRQRGLNFTPGSRHTYSHSDYTLLAIVIERAAGEPFGDHLERAIWIPLGLTSTRLHDDRGRVIPGRAFAYAATERGYQVAFPARTIVGGNNVYSTVEDLLRWERNFHTAAVGGRAIIDRMLSQPTLASGLHIPYAFGIMHDEYRGLPVMHRSASGGGFASEFMRFPEQGLTIVTLSNVKPSHPKLLSRAVAEVFISEQMQPLKSETVADATPVPVDELQRLPGLYRPIEDPWDVTGILARDGALFEEHRGEIFPMIRSADGRYHDGGLTYTFTPAADGGPLRMTLSTRTMRQELERCESDARWKPDAAALAEYVGRYGSDDLAIAWDFKVVDGVLMLSRPRDAMARPLEPVARDVLRCELGVADEPLLIGVQFTRNADGRITGFTVSAMPDEYEVARNVRFGRITLD